MEVAQEFYALIGSRRFGAEEDSHCHLRGNLLPGTWRDMLERIGRLPQPPFLIVTSRLADGHLWAEALNLGAYDVLAKPFDRNEVVRIVSLAWLHWKDQCETSPQAENMWMAAAG